MRTKLMDFSMTPSSRRLSRLLLRERVNYQLKTERQGPSPSDAQERLVRELRFFQREEKKISRKPEVLSLHGLLSHLSPYYGKVFSCADALGVKLNPVFKSQSRQLLEWDPFSEYVEVPAIRDEIELLLKQPLDAFTIADTVAILGMNTTAMHDVLHSLFQRLIPPPRGMRNLREYFLFLEALVFTAERYAYLQFGTALTDAFARLRFIVVTYNRDPVLRAADGDPEKVFLATLGNLLVGMHGWTEQKRRKRLPEYAPYIDSGYLNISPTFVKRISPQWTHYAKDHRYPERWRRQPTKLPRITIQNFSTASLLQKNQLQAIYYWHRELFGIDPKAKIPISE